MLKAHTAVDNHGAQASGSVHITVANGPPANRPPVISVPGPQVVEVGSTLAFTVSGSDPDGDVVTLSATGIPPNASFNPGTGMFTFTPALAQEGEVFVVTFTATDPEGASASAMVQITVIASDGEGQQGPPIISVPPSPIIIPVGSMLSFTVTGSSPIPNCAVLLGAIDLPHNSAFTPADGHFSFTPNEEQRDNSFVVIFTATDCLGQTATGSVTITVVGAASGGGGGGDTGPGRICVPVSKVFFAATAVNGGCGHVKVPLENIGAGKLTLSSIRLSNGTHFRVEGLPSGLATLQSAAVLELKIMFQPKAKGTLLDTLIINTNDSKEPTVIIQLKGKGKGKS